MSDTKVRKRKEFVAKPEWNAGRQVWQYAWFCREVWQDKNGKPEHGQWLSCNVVSDSDASHKQADALRKSGCTVTLERLPHKHP
jgi:hypothetical protein